MKKVVLRLSVMLLSSSLFFTSCNKNKDTVNADDSSQQSTTAADQSNFSSESDLAVNEASIAISNSSANGRVAATGFTVDSTNKLSGLYILNYSGTSEDGKRNRSGSIEIQVTPADAKWSAAGTTLRLTFNNYKVTRIATGKSITFNGTHVVTNISGGDMHTLSTASAGTSLEHKVRGSISLTFDDGTTRQWSVARHRVLTKKSGDYTLAISGDTTINNIANVEEWGINRLGESFYGAIPVTIEHNMSCAWNASKGEFVHHRGTKNLTLTFGVNSDGSANTSLSCPYGYRIDWTGTDGKARMLVVQY